MVTPSGCADCGEPQRSHGMVWSPRLHALHKFIAPDSGQIKARMVERRAEADTEKK